MPRTWIALCFLAAFASCAHGSPVVAKPKDEGLTFTIVHTNDMHARFEETSRLSTACAPEDSKAGKCYGGFARIATLVRQARKSEVPTLFLNAGDTYQGSVWYNVFKWEVVSKFLNILAPDAISLGNHEFDDGVSGLLPFIENAKFPIVTANLDLSQEPELQASKLLNSTILNVKGSKVGVIGYLTPETKMISNSEKVIFKDEVESIRAEAKRLKKEGVNILIALGHSGFDIDKQIAREVEDIDIVIGGHTNTFLFSGKQPDSEVPEGLYPTEVVQKSGRKVYVVQAYAYTKYLGNFSVTFNSQGEVTGIKGSPILVDGSVEQAEDVVKELNLMKKNIDSITKVEVGKIRVLLDGDSKVCRREECNLGNLVADAMIDYNVREYNSKNGWTDAAIAVKNSGSIRTSIVRSSDDTVTMGDVLGVLPFHNTIVKVSMTGQEIIDMLEWSVSRLDKESTANLFGAFLQVSGLQITYDLNQPSNSRVVAVKVRCAECNVPSYSNLDTKKVYGVLMNDFIHGGGDGFTMLQSLKPTPLGATTSDALIAYLKKHSPVYTSVDWRINYAHDNDKPASSVASSYESLKTMVFLPIVSWLPLK